MKKLEGQPVDGGHLDQLLACCGLLRQHNQRPAVFVGDAAVPGVKDVAGRLGAGLADYRATDLRVTLRPGPFEWSDRVPQTQRSEVVQLLTNLDRLRPVLGAAWGPAVPAALCEPHLPADAVWLCVVRPGWLRLCAARWLPGKRPVVYYGCSFALAADGKALAEEPAGAA